MLTEDDIKRRFLPFLKEFYKYRYEYRPESLHAGFDNVSAGGLVADGMLSFRKEDGSAFLCTYEATSADKAEEVKFSLNVSYFTWDCLAFAAVVTAVCYIAAYASRFAWLKGLQWTGNTGFLIGMGVIGFFIWYFTMRGWRKYRYIYAIEQFKQYFAHEQWIALGEDVFPAPTDPYLLELKSQCVYNGFGLALVPEEGEIRIINAPSRLGIYGKDRRMVQWVTRLQWYQAMSQNVGTLTRMRTAIPPEFGQAWNKMWRPVRYLLIDPLRKNLWGAFSRPLGRNTGAFDRFMQAHSVQKWIFVLCWVAITPLAYRVLTTRDDKIEDILERPDSNPEDQYGYLYEGEAPRYRDPRGIPKQDPEPAYRAPSADTVPTINLSGSSDEEEVPTINLSGDPEPEPPSPVAHGSDGAAPKADDPCARFQRQKGWLVQDGYFSNKAYADERATALRRNGLDVLIIPAACLGSKSPAQGYIVRIGATQASESAARAQAGKYTQALTRYGLLEGKLLVRRIN